MTWGSRWTINRYLSLIYISVYAPMANAPPSVKARFVDLQSTLDSLPAGDIVVVLGDFN